MILFIHNHKYWSIVSNKLSTPSANNVEYQRWFRLFSFWYFRTLTMWILGENFQKIQKGILQRRKSNRSRKKKRNVRKEGNNTFLSLVLPVYPLSHFLAVYKNAAIHRMLVDLNESKTRESNTNALPCTVQRVKPQAQLHVRKKLCNKWSKSGADRDSGLSHLTPHFCYCKKKAE